MSKRAQRTLVNMQRSVEGTIEWMLPALLGRKRISTKEFARKLQECGHQISLAQAYRLRNRGPNRFLRTLGAICVALDCKIVDLLYNVPTVPSGEPDLPRFRLPQS
jgi:DNA-binding Xre family transcriptional regulator